VWGGHIIEWIPDKRELNSHRYQVGGKKLLKAKKGSRLASVAAGFGEKERSLIRTNRNAAPGRRKASEGPPAARPIGIAFQVY